MYKLTRILFRESRKGFVLNKPIEIRLNLQKSTMSLPSTRKRSPLLLGLATGVAIGAGYSFYKIGNKPKPVLNQGMGIPPKIIKELPNVEISRRVIYPNDDSGLKLVLFQYTTCPFCCKVRAFLDYHGLSYDIVEVNPVMKQQMKWTDYKKVPILLVKAAGGYLQLNDSTMIISTLASYLHDKDYRIEQVANCYPTIDFVDSDGVVKKEILNRYFLMYQGNIPDGATKETIADERKWRQWADNILVHTLSPNVYRTREEALQSFRWFSEAGEWEKHFSVWEQSFVIYVGALAMWMIGKRIKKKYNLKDDVRQSLYDACNVWLKEIKKADRGNFHGGSQPNLADLAVFGVLNSIEGCSAFADLRQNTRISTWYDSIKHHMSSPMSREAIAATA